MFSKAIETLKSIGVRLALLTSGFFIIGTLILFAIIYVSLASSLTQADQERIDTRLHELAALYQTTKLAGLKRALDFENRITDSKRFFIRLAGPGKTLLFRQIPDQWADFDLTPLEALDGLGPPSRFQLRAKDDDDATLEVASLSMPDGTVLQVGRNSEDRDHVLEVVGSIFAGTLIPLIVAGFAGGAMLAHRTLAPIRQLIGTVRFINAGSLEARVPVPKNEDELNELANLFNNMLDKIARVVIGMRGALDDVAHELRTPLARLRGEAELALQSGQGLDAAREALAGCIEESTELQRLLDVLMDISESESGTLRLNVEPIEVSSFFEQMLDLYRILGEEKNIAISRSIAENVSLVADRSRLRQMVSNLLDNAIKYTLAGGRVDLSVERHGSEVTISVADTGIGMAPEVLDRSWERLYRGQRCGDSRGLGLGLSFVKAIAQAHGGRVAAKSAPGMGSTFTIMLPAGSSKSDSKSVG
jgi:signal transduction histidine kinase